ncbi:hypothetical protein LTR94_025642, partial [Friedmanniomyces endolithicus]
ATASSRDATDTIAPGEWAAPVQAFANGAAGGSGLNNKSVFAYQRATSAPSAPSVNATYTFSTATLSGLNNGWSAAIPDGTGILWVTTASALSTSDTDTIAPGEWATVEKLAQDGAPGISPLLVTAQPAALQLQGDTTGAAVPGALPAYIENGAARAGVPATITDVTIDAASGCTASVADDGTTIAITAISLPYVSHPATTYLGEVGLLKPLVLQTLSGELDGPAFNREGRLARRRSSLYISNLAQSQPSHRQGLALSLARLSVEKAPSNPLTGVALARILSRAGEHDQAVAEMERVTVLTRGDPNYLVHFVNALMAANRPAEALSTAREVVNAWPHMAHLHAWESAVLWAAGETRNILGC